MRIGKIENDFLEVKIELRRLIGTITPYKSAELDSLLSQVDSLVTKAVNKYIADNEQGK